MCDTWRMTLEPDKPQVNLRESENQIGPRLLEVVREVSEELHPGGLAPRPPRLSDSLDRDLGFDSLGRVELIARTERVFGVTLPEDSFAEIETPGDLLRALFAVRGNPIRGEIAPVQERAIGRDHDAHPEHADTLVDMLRWHVERHGDDTHVRILGDDRESGTLSYRELWDGAGAIARGLQELGVQPGETVALMLASGRDYFVSFYGVLLCGATPVPIYPPMRRSQIEDHLRRHRGILDSSRSVVLITLSEARLLGRLLQGQVASLREVVTVAELEQSQSVFTPPRIQAGDIAFVQYTSGSTGAPKGVMLSHANLLANIRAMGAAVNASARDVFVSWLPLYHDMGLIGAWLGSLYFGALFINMSPLSFLARPQRWLWAIDKYKGTLSAAPNFAYELCMKRIDEQDIRGLDLHSWRLAFNGAEAVSPNTLRRFGERFAPYGFSYTALTPVYGLAESSVGLAFPPLGRGPWIDCVNRASLSGQGRALVVNQQDEHALCFASSGQPLRDHEIRVVDENNDELPERHQGRLQFRGPSATQGYLRNPDASRDLFYGDSGKERWLNSGDLAYIANGEVFITGRCKDVIIRAGRNIYPHELEEAVGAIDGVRKGCVAVFGAQDARTGTERLVVLAETRETSEQAKSRLQDRINRTASDILDQAPDDIVLAPPHTVLKTSSGKIRRAASRALYEQGNLHTTDKAAWLQIVHIGLATLTPLSRRAWRRVVSLGYASWMWTAYVILAAIAWSGVLLLPRMRWRWSLMRGLARALARLSATPVNVSGLERLPPPEQPVVYVCNHGSYLDGYVLVAAVPRIFSFVAKSEFRQAWLARSFIHRIGALMVERFDLQRSHADAQRIAARVAAGDAMMFFPEGTFSRIPGLRAFHMGAFVAAAQTGVPVVPVVLCGTRGMLRAGSWLPRHGAIQVIIGEPIASTVTAEAENPDAVWREALRLRDAARAFMLTHCGEPDLARVFRHDE